MKLDLKYIMDFEENFKNIYQEILLKIRIFFYICRAIDSNHNKFVTFKDLTKEFKRSISQVSQNVKELEKDGFIVKEQIKNSKKSDFHVKIFLTNKGILFKKYILYKIIGKHD